MIRCRGRRANSPTGTARSSSASRSRSPRSNAWAGSRASCRRRSPRSFCPRAKSCLDSHRREMTVVFCDLRGFTAFAETAEPEEVIAVLREYHADLGGLIHKFEGTLERFAGDGIMVLFNDPLPCADPALRAVRLAVAMRDHVAELAANWRKLGHELGFGVGIAHGYATLGRIGFEGRFDYSAIGTVVNLAARLCGEAKNGQILIDSKVFAAIEELAETEPVGGLVLKGFHRPIQAFNVNVCALHP